MTVPKTDHTTVSAPLTISLFGPMRILVNGDQMVTPRSRKALWLLALLTLRHNRSVEREWLAGTLWPDMNQSQAFANLRRILSELRTSLRNQGRYLQSPSRHTLFLDLADADVDVMVFDAAIASGEPSAMERAVTLYRGPLLEGCSEEWVGQERIVREQACLHALQSLADLALMVGDYSHAVGHYQQAMSLDPWSDSARRGSMEALARAGDTNTALQVYREFVELLKSDPKAVPDEQTSALYMRLRAEARRRSEAPSQAVAHAVAATPAAQMEVGGYLPQPLTDLVGRVDECLEVAARLRRSRLVTLTGLGGIGKTRLAITVAEQIAREYADGVWLVALESLNEGHLVVRQSASILGIKEEAGRSLLQSVSDYLRNKRLLLVLDNCEHLLEASARFATHLLQHSAGIRILATSREALGIAGETVSIVPTLTVPALSNLSHGHTALPHALLSYEGIQLFVERAQAAQSTFQLTGSNALTVAQICSRLEGIPLAIELSAARVKAMTVDQIASRLNDHLGLLLAGSRTALPRQQTLRATLDWSYELLGDAEQILLRRLSVFAGGCTLEAAEQVCLGADMESDAVSELLVSLVDKSLVSFSEQERGGRYRLLEMVRQYGARKLETSGETEQSKVRHRDYFLALAEEAEPQLAGPDQTGWLERLEAEHANLRASMDWCMEEGGAQSGLQLAGALYRFWWTHGHIIEGREWCKRALESSGAQVRTLERAKVLHGAGNLDCDQGDYASASAFYEESLAIRREKGDRVGIANSLNNLGFVAYEQGDYASTHAYHKESLAISYEIDNRTGIASSLNGLGDVANIQGEYASAHVYYEESLAIYREIGNQRGIANSLNGAGNLAYEQGEYVPARAFYEESLVIFRELGNGRGSAIALNNLGFVADIQGDYASAQVYYEESLTIYKEIGDRRGIVYSLEAFARLASRESKSYQAIALWGAAAALREQIGVPLPPNEGEAYEREVAEARRVLGKEIFSAAWVAGAAMTIEQAIEYALRTPTAEELL